MPSKNIPSLENLINQCCENYYARLNESVQDIQPKLQQIQEQNYYSYEKFQDFINASHCQENLKFLIEIYHYEKIWNKTFKRQSSILKCKEDIESSSNINSAPSSTHLNSRKQSVATIRTMNSRKSNRHPSIVEEDFSSSFSPDFQSSEQKQQKQEQEQETQIQPPLSASSTEEDPASPVTAASNPVHVLTNNDLNKLVQELSLPKILKSGDDFDSNSFVNQDFEKSLASSPPPSKSLFLKKSSTEVWDTLFKPSYICENNSECQCHETMSDGDDNKELNEALEQQELAEQFKSELREKFEYIITDYVINNSPYQINLPDTVYSNLLKEYENNKILYHSPLTLLPAKNAVLQLLRENIYYNFLVDQENLINKEDNAKLISKMDKLKINTSTSQEASKVPSNESYKSTKSAQEKSAIRRELPLLKTAKSHHQLSSSAVLSRNTSEESLKSRSNTPISTISNFLNKYHIKIHHSNSSSSISSSLTENSNSNSNSSINSSSPISPIVKAKTFSPSTNTGKHDHKHLPRGTKYVKGPCGIDPEITDYDPHPPKQHSWSKMGFKFKNKKQ